MKVYRYLEAEWGVESLRSKHLKVSDPSKFNDPFECSPNYRPRNEHEFFSVLARKEYMIREEWEQGARSLPYEDFKRHWLEELPRIIDERLPRLRENLTLVEDGNLKAFAEKFRVISFSRSLKSMLLWAHYAKSHSGVVLEFDTRDEYLSQLGQNSILDVIYSSKKYLIDDWSDQDDENTLESKKTIAWKSLEWAYEEEVRAIIATEALNDDFLLFKGNPIRAVYLGVDFDENLIPEVASILSDSTYSQTSLFKASKCRDSFKLNFSKLTI